MSQYESVDWCLCSFRTIWNSCARAWCVSQHLTKIWFWRRKIISRHAPPADLCKRYDAKSTVDLVSIHSSNTSQSHQHWLLGVTPFSARTDSSNRSLKFLAYYTAGFIHEVRNFWWPGNKVICNIQVAYNNKHSNQQDRIKMCMYGSH